MVRYLTLATPVFRCLSYRSTVAAMGGRLGLSVVFVYVKCLRLHSDVKALF